jgi:hypothetical protein
MKKILFVLVLVFGLVLGAIYLIGRFASVAKDPVRGNQPSAPVASACTMDAKVCPDGTAVGRDGANGCEFLPCPDPAPTPDDGPVACTMEARVCPDGSAVGRDGERACAFAPCPGEGTVIGRITLESECPYETVFDKPCPTDTYEGDIRLEPATGGRVEIVEARGGVFYATLPAGSYKISSGRALPRCDATFSVTDGGETDFSASCYAGVR